MSTAPGTPAAGADQAAAPEPSPWNIANALTVLRILMVPVFVWLLLRDPGAGGEHLELWWAFAVFALAAITDRIDARLRRCARRGGASALDRHTLGRGRRDLRDEPADRLLVALDGH